MYYPPPPPLMECQSITILSDLPDNFCYHLYTHVERYTCRSKEICPRKQHNDLARSQFQIIYHLQIKIIYTPRWRETLAGVKYFAQEHNTMTWPGEDF